MYNLFLKRYYSSMISEERKKINNMKTTWRNMIDRCNKSNDYMSRGIKVCSKWRNSFDAFLDDMGYRPDNMVLDRKDNNKGYDKENCRWVSYSTQNINKRVYKSYTTGARGVSLNKKTGKYFVTIYIEPGKRITLKRNLSFQEAVELRAWAEEKYYKKKT